MNWFRTLAKNQSYMFEFTPGFYIPLIYFSILMSILSLLLQIYTTLKSVNINLQVVSFSKYFWLFFFISSSRFYNQLVSLLPQKRSSENFHWNCIDFIDQFGVNCHLNNIESTSLWAWCISPFIKVAFNFSLKCFVVVSVKIQIHDFWCCYK